MASMGKPKSSEDGDVDRHSLGIEEFQSGCDEQLPKHQTCGASLPTKR